MATELPSSMPIREEWSFLMPQKIIRAAGYKRVSSDKQAEGLSLQFQDEKIRAWAHEQGWLLKEDHIYQDSYSGAYWRERVGLQEMLKAARRREFDKLILYDLDRFARELPIQIIVHEELAYYGVELVVIDPKQKHAGDDTFEGEIVRTIGGLIAQEERRKIIKRSHDGMQTRVVTNKRLMPSHSPLYGYMWDDPSPKAKNRYLAHPQESLIIKQVYAWADTGIAIRQIAKKLTDMGIKTPSGKDFWKPQLVLDILKNPSYCGKAYAFKWAYAFVPGEGMRRKKRPESEWIELPEGTIEAIVTVEQYEKVKHQLEWNKVNAARRNPDPQGALLRCGLISCGVCGAGMYMRRKYTKFANGSNAYRCTKRQNAPHLCNNGEISIAVVESSVWDKVLSIIRDPEVLHKILLEREKADNPVTDSLATVDRLILKTGTRIKNLMENLEEENDTETRKLLRLRINELAEQKKGFEEERDQLGRQEFKWEKAMEAFQRFKLWCEETRQRIDQTEYQPTYSEKREACEQLGIMVVVFPVGSTPRYTIDVNPPDIVSAWGPPF